MTAVTCPACGGINGGTCQQLPVNFEGGAFNCFMCGAFKVTGSALPQLTRNPIADIQRAALSHQIRSAQGTGKEVPLIDSTWLEKFLKDAILPTPAEQATFLIIMICSAFFRGGGYYYRRRRWW